MASRKTRLAYLALPGGSWASRASLVLLATAGVTIFVMGRSGNPAAERFQSSLMDAITPVVMAASSPFEAISDAGAWFKEMALLREENIALKNQNRELLKWQLAAKDMKAENESLRKLLNVPPAKARSFVTAKMVSDMGGPYVHSALINAGSEQGIAKNQPVMSEQGLIGRTTDVGNTSARVLLLNDINSRVPVMVESTRAKSILAGNNDALPTLSYLSVNDQTDVGDRIVTSGDGGVFPAGVPVGVVVSVDKALGIVQVQPFVDAASAEYISVIDYSF